ncbi:MAG: hypothetical protein WCL50_13805 [Spirochaetota bacterium]
MRSFSSSLLIALLSCSIIPPLSAETATDPSVPGNLPSNLPPPSPGSETGQILTSLRAPVEVRPDTALSGTLPSPSPEPAIATSLFDGRKVVAFYGRPGSKSMGILGEYPKEELATLLFAYARLYSDANGGAGIIPAFYLIYGTCWPEGEIGYLRDAVVEEWIDYAAQNGIMIILDNQIGRYGVDAAMNRLLPWLAYPNVHLALDPEWRTVNPMKTIGSISASELNMAQGMMSDWLVAKADTSERILVIHQFSAKMIGERERVRADYPGVRLIHSADGFGSPPIKKKAYAFNALAGNMPRKGVKLFMKTQVRGAGYDEPLLTPAEVVGLDPSPELIIYQ